MLAYVDDLIITVTSLKVVNTAKNFLHSQFKIKDMRELRYFLGIEVDRISQGIFLSQKKCICDLIAEYGMTGCKSLKLPIDGHVKMMPTERC